MDTPTNIYVDPDIGEDAGTGTIDDPYGSLQYAWDSMPINSTDGDQFTVIE